MGPELSLLDVVRIMTRAELRGITNLCSDKLPTARPNQLGQSQRQTELQPGGLGQLLLDHRAAGPGHLQHVR